MNFVRKRNKDIDLEKVDFSVCESGIGCTDLNWRSEALTSLYSRLYYIIEGDGGHIKSESEHIVMHAGHIYLIPAGYRYSYWCESGVRKVYFHINIKREDGYDALADFGKVGEIYCPELVSTVAEMYKRDDISSALMLKSKLLESVAVMADKYEYNMGSNKVLSRTLGLATIYIQKNLSIKLSREEVAHHCRVSPGTVAKCFKNELGVPIGKYIDDLVFIEARRRLMYTDDLIGTISDDLGFCDQFYFSRRFSELYGDTPFKFRRKMQNMG